MKTTINTQQERIKVLQQIIVKRQGGMELLLGVGKKLQEQIDTLEERISATRGAKDDLTITFREADKLDLELRLIEKRFFDGKFNLTK